MQVVAFIGSPRKKGNTHMLVERVLQGAADSGAETKTIFLNDLKIRECQACMKCKNSSLRCVLNDDMRQLYPIIESADVIVLGSPIYFGYVSGLMKIFIDRWYAYSGVPDEKKLAKGKKILLVIPFGRLDKDLFTSVARQIGQAFKYVFAAKVTSLMVPGVRESGEVSLHDEYLQLTYDTGKLLCSQDVSADS